MNADSKLKAQVVKVERWFKSGINVSCVDRGRHRLVRPAVSSRLAKRRLRRALTDVTRRYYEQ